MFSYDKVKEILFIEDVQGLIKLGAPENEYDNEAFRITNRLNSEGASTVNDVLIVLYGVFAESFGCVFYSDNIIKFKSEQVGEPEKYRSLANKIWQTKVF